MTCDTVAYVMFTSGSTGSPLGVCGTQRGLVNRCRWMAHTFPFRPVSSSFPAVIVKIVMQDAAGPKPSCALCAIIFNEVHQTSTLTSCMRLAHGHAAPFQRKHFYREHALPPAAYNLNCSLQGDVVAVKTPISFVDSLWETFGPLICGVSCVVLPPSLVLRPRALVAQLAHSRATHFVSVPSLLRLALPALAQAKGREEGAQGTGQDSLRLRVVVSSGEPLPRSLAEDLAAALPQGCVLLNLYGSTEVSADATCYVCSPPCNPASGAQPVQHVDGGEHAAWAGPHVGQEDNPSRTAGTQGTGARSCGNGKDEPGTVGQLQQLLPGSASGWVPAGLPIHGMAVFIAQPQAKVHTASQPSHMQGCGTLAGGLGTHEGEQASPSRGCSRASQQTGAAVEPLALGVVGEVVVAGTGVAEGYLAAPGQKAPAGRFVRARVPPRLAHMVLVGGATEGVGAAAPHGSSDHGTGRAPAPVDMAAAAGAGASTGMDGEATGRAQATGTYGLPAAAAAAAGATVTVNPTSASSGLLQALVSDHGLPAFRTGDLGYIHPQTGQLLVLGRLDHQVKVHGVRVDVLAVEAAVCCAPGVKEAAVVALPAAAHAGRDRHSVTHDTQPVVPHPRSEAGAPESSSSRGFNEAAVMREGGRGVADGGSVELVACVVLGDATEGVQERGAGRPVAGSDTAAAVSGSGPGSAAVADNMLQPHTPHELSASHPQVAADWKRLELLVVNGCKSGRDATLLASQ